MIKMMAGSPALILRLREPLGLSAEQAQQIEEIRRHSQREHEQHVDAAMRAMYAAETLLECDIPDLVGYEAKIREAVGHQVQANLSMARSKLDAGKVLTFEQRSNLRFGIRMMRQMTPGRIELLREKKLPKLKR